MRFLQTSFTLLIAGLTAECLSLLSDSVPLWGPYRPNLYVGIRPRIPNSVLAGLMWSNAETIETGIS